MQPSPVQVSKEKSRKHALNHTFRTILVEMFSVESIYCTDNGTALA